jgi:RNA polymerase sigma factor (sigma-70 family)
MAETAENLGDINPANELSRTRELVTHSVFFRTHAPRLEALIRGRLSPRFQMRFDPEDIVQSAFRSFFLRPIPAADDAMLERVESDLWPLLAEIAIRKLSQQIRRHSAQRRDVATDVVNRQDVASNASSPSESASLSEVIALTQNGLDERSRTAFLLRLEGYEILEIAERLAISERTVRRSLSEAKQILQRLLSIEPEPSTSRQFATAVQELSVDLRFDDYRLHQWIGDGAVGNVYRATEKASGLTVAIKFLKKAFRFHPQAVASFRQEVRLVAELNHPGIIRIMGLGRALRSSADRPSGAALKDGDFLVLDWAPGGDLARHVAPCRPSLASIQGWMLELTDALQHAHEQGVVHCDLKPSNVLIGPRGQLWISDFGLARQYIGWTDFSISHGGTPAFIAPELVDPCWGPIGPWTDTFGLGAILYNLLTRLPLYQGKTCDAILARAINPEPISWPVVTELPVPHEWRAVVDRLLMKNVAARFPDMLAVRDAIAELRPPSQ